MIQPQPEAWVLEPPPPTAMETQYSRTNCGPGGCTTYEPLFPVCPDYIWGSTELIACSTGWVTAESVTVLHLKKEKQRGQALVWLSTASSAKRRGLFKTALKAGGVEQTDKLSRAVWQADGEGLVLCIDLPWGNMESLHYHHPPTTHPELHEIIPSPPRQHYPGLCRVAAGFVGTSPPLQDDIVLRRIVFPASVWARILTVNI